MSTDMVWPTDQAGLLEAEATTDDHTACCPDCTTGRACITADGFYTDEFRAYQDWTSTDRAAAHAYRNSQIDQ